MDLLKFQANYVAASLKLDKELKENEKAHESMKEVDTDKEEKNK